MITITPKASYEELVACISVGLTPLLTSSPGIGKSSICLQVAEDYRLKPIDLRLSQCTPEDLQGFPMRTGNKATFTPFDVFPLEGDDIPEGYDGWLLFLDELTSATKPVQAAAYKLILDRMVGSFKLHPQVAIVAAGNKASDKAVVNQMSTALQSRLIHYELEANPEQWVEWAYKNGIDHRIISYISYMPTRLMDFRPDHQDKTFPCPRTWEFLSRLIKGKTVSEEIMARTAGTIGIGVATEFITFAREFDRLPKISDILADPSNAKIPNEVSTKYATASMLVENFDEHNLDKIITYIDRFSIEMKILFGRGVLARKPEIRVNHKGFNKFATNMVRYLS
jgi:MoxR-like ATPase